MKLLEVKTLAPLQLGLLFNDHTRRVFDGAGYLADRQGPLLEALRDPVYFARCFVDSGALCWPNGLALSPARLYEMTATTAADSL
jgi:hypothetical protein